MAIGQRRGGGVTPPLAKYDTRVGRLYDEDRVFEAGSWQSQQRDVTADYRAAWDLANLLVGYMSFAKNAPLDTQMVSAGDGIGEPPSKDFSPGLLPHVPMSGEKTAREMLSTSGALWEAIDALHDRTSRNATRTPTRRRSSRLSAPTRSGTPAAQSRMCRRSRSSAGCRGTGCLPATPVPRSPPAVGESRRRRSRTEAAAAKPAPCQRPQRHRRRNSVLIIEGEFNMTALKPAPGDPAILDTADPFDLDNLRLRQDFAETVGVKKLLMTIPVRRPSPQDFVRVHPTRPTGRISGHRAEGRPRALRRHCGPAGGTGERVHLCDAVHRHQPPGRSVLWPVRLPGPDGKINEWWRSAAKRRRWPWQKWVRVKANMSLGAYEIFTSPPARCRIRHWPELPFTGTAADCLPGSDHRQPGPSGHEAAARRGLNGVQDAAGGGGGGL